MQPFIKEQILSAATLMMDEQMSEHLATLLANVSTPANHTGITNANQLLGLISQLENFAKLSK